MTVRVLLVEDSPTDAKLVVRELERAGFALHWHRVDAAAELRAALAAEPWDLVISDWNMPGFGASAALAIVKESALDLPFIIVSGTIGEEDAVDAMRAGANDFVLKDRLARLAPAVERELRESENRRSRRRSEQALRQAEARLGRLAESGIVGIAYTDLDGVVCDGNDAFLRMIGYTRADLHGGLRWNVVNPPEWHAHDAEVTARLAADGIAGPWEQELVASDGTRVPVLIGVAMVDERSCVSFFADLTARKQAERALHRSEEQLRQVQKMEAIGSLAGGVAHDFNNLLTVILSYCDLVLSDLPDDEAMRVDIGEIQRAGQRAAELTRQLLAFSRRQVLQPRVLDLGTVVGGMEKMLRRLIGEDVQLTLDHPEGPALVKVDRGQLDQVIMNLAVNARDAMPRGGRLAIEVSHVTLDAAGVAERPGSAAGPHVRLSVVDTGGGIDDATRARIFEPFFTTKDMRGTGLGLSTVLGIVQQSGGTITVSSTVGVGTGFEILFPVAADTHTTRASSSAVTPGDNRGTETILLVEDDPQVRTLTGAILRRCGYRVLEAQSGGDALLLSDQHTGTIDLLLTDVVMPHLSGRQLSERLATTRPHMPTLYMSGYTDDAIVRHGVLEASMAFLHKPFTPDALAARVRETLDATPLV